MYEYEYTSTYEIYPTPTAYTGTPDWTYDWTYYRDAQDIEDRVPVKFAAAGLVFIALPPCIFFFFLSLKYARGGVQWARPCYNHFLAAFGLFNFSCIMQFIVLCILAVGPLLHGKAVMSVLDTVGQVYSYLVPITHFFDSITDLFVFLCLCSLSTGVAMARTGFSGGIHTTTKFASYALVAIMSAIAAIYMGIFIWIQVTTEADWFNSDYLNYNGYSGYSKHCWADPNCGPYVDERIVDEYDSTYLPAMRLNFAFVILIWFLSLAVLARSISQLRYTKVERNIQMTTRYLAACAVLWVARTSFKMGVEIHSKLGYYWRHGLGMSYTLNVINVFVSIWFLGGIFILLYLLGRNKTYGLFPQVTYSSTAQKGLQVFQPDKGFQDIEIPLQPVCTRCGPSNHVHLESPSAPQAPETQRTTAGTFQNDDIESAALQVPGQVYGSPIQPQRQQNHHYDLDQESDDMAWVRPPSTEPPSHFIPRKPMAGETLPSHEDLMGLNHQADGHIPSTALPYETKQ
jgi:hypothetical protein